MHDINAAAARFFDVMEREAEKLPTRNTKLVR
jgi:hypothetical protein